MKRFRLPALIAIASASTWLIAHSRASTETPDYKVVRTDEKFEIRDYSALTVATTSMAGSGMNGSFGELLGFISGKNESLNFIMPRETVEAGVPKPADEDVKVTTLEAGRFVVLSFEGARTAEVEKEAVGKLNAWLAKEKIAAKGTPIFAYYDPPWTPVFMRRNEVMVQIDKAPE